MKTVTEYLFSGALAHPEKIALADRAQRLSWREFSACSRRVEALIRRRGWVNKPVGVVALHDVWTPVLFMGVACSRNFYVPIDPELPREKLSKIVADAGMELILTTAAQLPVLEQAGVEVCHLRPQELAEGAEAEEVGDQKGLREEMSLEDPLYMVYTSGSTGMPKGVLKTHGAMIDFTEAYCETFSFRNDEIIGNQTPFFFDASAKDLYLLLKTGATMEILPTELFSFPVKLIAYLNARKVSFLCWVPSALSIVTQLDTFSEIKPETVKKVFFVGEVFPMKQLNRWRKALPGLTYVNLYGSSEIAGICCYYEIPQEKIFTETESLPIGTPLQNCKVLLLSEGRPVKKPEEAGEICVSSKALAREYFNDSEKTSNAFVTMDPDGSGAQRYFKTGDMAHWDRDGNLVFESRRDFQIKHMGHRIELGEIEAVALTLEEVSRCGCVYNEKKRRIELFCQLKEGVDVTGRQLQQSLREKLSTYMVPGRVTVLEEIPLNANGKIDRQALKRKVNEKELT